MSDLDTIHSLGDGLTERQLWVLERLETARVAGDDEEDELVYEKGVGFVGCERVSGRTVLALVRACAVSLDSSSSVGGLERYTINETGQEILKRRGRGAP